MYKKLTITTIIILLLCITVSFAWMMDVIGPSGDLIVYEFDDSLYISPNNLKIDITVEENGEYVPLYSTDNEVNNLVCFENKAPGDIMKFSMKITNSTDLDITTAIIFSDITSNEIKFYDFVSVGIFATNGFEGDYKAPGIGEFLLIDNFPKDENRNPIINENNSAKFIESLVIPANNKEVEIRFYVRINHVADNSIQNKEFKIGKINFMSV